MMYVCVTPSKALLNYATNPRISFIVHPCLVNMLQLMEGKSVSLCDFWKTSTNWRSLWLVSCRCYHPHIFQKYTTQQSSQKSKTDWGSILDRPLPARTLASLGGTSFGLLWQPLPLMAPVLVCSGSLRMEADRAKLIKESQWEINQILPHHQHSLLDEDVVENLPARPPLAPASRSHAMASSIDKRTQPLV